MQSIDPHTKEYVYRMQDESLFIVLCSEMVGYYEKRGQADVTCTLALRLLEHLYYKPEPVYEALRRFAVGKLEEADALAAKLAADADAAAAAEAEKRRREEERAKIAEEEGDEFLDDEDADEAEAKEASEIPYPTGCTFPPASLPESMDRLSLIIYKGGVGRQKARAMLCDIFNKALVGISAAVAISCSCPPPGEHLADGHQHADSFNRAMAQLGLAAFRMGLFPEAQACLGELYMAVASASSSRRA